MHCGSVQLFYVLSKYQAASCFNETAHVIAWSFLNIWCEFALEESRSACFHSYKTHVSFYLYFVLKLLMSLICMLHEWKSEAEIKPNSCLTIILLSSVVVPKYMKFQKVDTAEVLVKKWTEKKMVIYWAQKEQRSNKGQSGRWSTHQVLCKQT